MIEGTLSRVQTWLSSSRSGIYLAILGTVLCAPSLGAGWFLDDFAHRSTFLGSGEMADHMRSPALMFSFTDGNPEHTREAMETGFYPWWTSEDVLLNFWRPVTAATHALDYWLWPDSAFLMHAQSLCWFFVTVVLVVAFYRRVGSTEWAAGLAGLLFVLDESHGLPVAWIANRNALVALFFGVLCLLCHLRWRETTRSRWLVLGSVALVFSVHANEGGIATTGYLFAYALFLDRDRWARRLGSLLPYAILVVAWRFYYQLLGFGASGSPTYIDPANDPGRFLTEFVTRVPVLLAAQLSNLPGEPFEFLPDRLKLGHWGIALLTVAIGLGVMVPVLRASRRARFFALGSLISLIPASATFPSGRLLVFASLGGAGLIAQYLVWARRQRDEVGQGHRFVPVVLVSLHLVLAPLALVSTGFLLGYASRWMISGYEAIEYPDDISSRRLFLINPPNYFLTTYANLYRSLNGLPIPAGSHILAPNGAAPVEMVVTRVDEDTLRFAPDGGFRYLLFRDTSAPFAPGDRVSLQHLEIEISSVDSEGRALEVEYHFPAPLESGEFYWMKLERSLRLRQYTPPALGQVEVFNRNPDL